MSWEILVPSIIRYGEWANVGSIYKTREEAIEAFRAIYGQAACDDEGRVKILNELD